MKLFFIILILQVGVIYATTTNDIIIEDVFIDNINYISYWKNASLGYWFRDKFIYY
jgi:hypothetical protein